MLISLCNFVIVLLTAIPPHFLTHAYMLVFSTYGTATMIQFKEIILHIFTNLYSICYGGPCKHQAMHLISVICLYQA